MPDTPRKPGPKPITGRTRTSAERQAERMARLRAAVKERDRYLELYGPLPVEGEK